MKRILFLLTFIVAVCTVSSAQYLTRYPSTGKDSLSNTTAKTITWASTPNGLQGIRVTFDNATGTSAGKGYLETRIDTTNGSNEWVTIDSVTIADNTTKIWNLTNAGHGHYGNGYRIRFAPTGTHKTYFWAAYLRR